MDRLSIPASECQYHDYSQAAAFFKELGCTKPPQLGLLTYYQNEEVSVSTVGWCVKEHKQNFALPAFKAFGNTGGYPHIAFIPMDEHEIFLIDGCLYMTVLIREKPAIRRINLLFDESIVGVLNSIHNLPETEFELCRIYNTDKRFLGYYWVGECSKHLAPKQPRLAIYPVFGGNDTIFKTNHGSELEIVKISVGETFTHNAALWVVGYDEQYGVSLIRFIDFPDNSGAKKHMLN